MFRRGIHLLPFSIGIHFTSPSTSAEPEPENDDIFHGEWNQDGPGNYYRRHSFIQIHPRLVVDDICYVKFTITLPPSILPPPKSSRVFNVEVKAYELGDPYNVTEPSMARFMVLNSLGVVSSPESRRILDRIATILAPLKRRSIRYTRFIV